MNSMLQKFWCIKLICFFCLLSCNNRIKSKTKSIDKLNQAKKTNNFIHERTENNSFSDSNIILTKDNNKTEEFGTSKKQSLLEKQKKHKRDTIAPKKTLKIKSGKILYKRITEKEYWTWRKSSYYLKDSLGKRKLYKIDIFKNYDSIKFEREFQKVWNRYLAEKEKNNVVWVVKP